MHDTFAVFLNNTGSSVGSSLWLPAVLPSLNHPRITANTVVIEIGSLSTGLRSGIWGVLAERVVPHTVTFSTKSCELVVLGLLME